MGTARRLWVDDTTHTLHFVKEVFPCDRDIEAALPWQTYALLLSSDTDSLSLWDDSGLVRLTKAGVYPQDMAIHDDLVTVCGGADGKLHLFSLPSLQETAEIPLPGMPERICIALEMTFILTLLTEPDIHTALLQVQLDGQWLELRRYRGIPEAIAADKSGLWIAVSDGVTRLSWKEIGI